MSSGFLTGGTGYVGSAVLDALLRAGHRVTAIARDPEKVAGLVAWGQRFGRLGTPARYVASRSRPTPSSIRRSKTRRAGSSRW